MSDDRKGPVFRRAQSHQDRDQYIEKHAVPTFVREDGTGRYSGPDLAAIRARRPTPERIRHVEEKHDALAAIVTETRVSVARMDGKIDTLVDLASKAEAERSRRSEADAKERERIANVSLAKQKTWPSIIKAIGYALALIVAAYVGKGAL